MPAAFSQGCNYAHITTAATTIIATSIGPNGAPGGFNGYLNAITVNTPAAGTITVYDNLAGSGTVIAVITVIASAEPFTLSFNVQCKTALTIVNSATMDITVSYF